MLGLHTGTAYIHVVMCKDLARGVDGARRWKEKVASGDLFVKRFTRYGDILKFF